MIFIQSYKEEPIPCGLNRILEGADENVAYAHWLMGNSFFYGHRVDKSLDKAKHHFKLGSQLGCVLSQRFLASLLEDQGGSTNEESLYWWIQAAQNGDREAQEYAGKNLVLKGRSSDEINQGINFLKLAYYGGSVEAEINYAMYQYCGTSLGVSIGGADMFLSHHSEMNNPMANYIKGMLQIHFREKNEEVYAKAKQFFELAAAANLAPAIRWLGKLYCNPQTSFFDPYLGLKWTMRAAILDDPVAQVDFGNHLVAGPSQDLLGARHWYKESIKNGNPYGMFHYAESFTNMSLDSDELKDQIENALDAYNNGVARSCHLLTNIIYRNQSLIYQYPNALKWLERTVSEYDVSYAPFLGGIYLGNIPQLDDMPVNAKKGLFWLQAGVEEQYCEAMLLLASELISGVSTKKDAGSAVGYLKKCVALGDSGAAALLANLYMEGKCVIRNPKFAAQLNEHSATKGNATASHNLAVQLQNGDGVQERRDVADYYFNKSISLRVNYDESSNRSFIDQLEEKKYVNKKVADIISIESHRLNSKKSS